MHEYGFDEWQDLFENMRKRLYPCPFCGAVSKDLMFDWTDNEHLAVYCCNCDSRGPELDTQGYDQELLNIDDEALAKEIVQDTINNWNKRHRQ